MARSPVLILDDGELDDIQEILESLGVDYGRVRGGAILADTPPPTRLLVATPRRIDAVGEIPPGEEDELVRIVVSQEDSNSMRERLREIGFDYLVRRPVHPEALRLLLMHALYRGDERRSEPRVPVGFEVSFRTGIRPRQATLADLSSRGCRLLSAYALEPGKRIRVQIPVSLGATEPLSIEGRVLRMRFDERIGTEGLYSAAVRFENVSTEVRHELEWIIEDTTQGPPTLADSDGAIEEDREESVGEPVHTARRRRPRRDIQERVSPNLKPDPRSEGSADCSRGLGGLDKLPALGMPIDVQVDVAEEPENAEPISDSDLDRRAGSRRSWQAKVPAFGTRALRVLVGRDLSVGGMRVEAGCEVELGDRLNLAIYGQPSEEPFLVWGTVMRDDGAAGMGVVFDEVDPTIAAKLEQLVASLPPVESLHDSEAEAMGTVVTEILD